MLNYLDRGLGTCVILVHGFTDQSMSWFLADPDLLLGYRIVSVDLPGHGRSDPWAGEKLTIHDMAEELDQVVRNLGVTRFALVGHSMGGMVVQQYCIEHPEKISSLFLCCTAARGALLRDTAFNLGGMRDEILRAGIAKAVSADPYSAFAPGYDSPLVEKYLELEYVTDDQTAVKCLDAIEEWELDKQTAGTFGGQTIIICGESDRITPGSFAPEIEGSFVNSTVEMISGSGHMVFLEKPVEFDAVVRKYLGGVAGGAD